MHGEQAEAMLRSFRVKSVSIRRLRGKPKIEFTMYYGPLRIDENRVNNLKNLWDHLFPNNDNRIQSIVAPHGFLEVA